jgi:hypothetical protein
MCNYIDICVLYVCVYVYSTEHNGDVSPNNGEKSYIWQGSKYLKSPHQTDVNVENSLLLRKHLVTRHLATLYQNTKY